VGRTAGAGREAGPAPQSQIEFYTSLNNKSLPLSRLAPGDQVGGVGPLQQSTRLLAQTETGSDQTRRNGNLEPAGRPARGERDP
jgi:hypothetical protein